MERQNSLPIGLAQYLSRVDCLADPHQRRTAQFSHRETMYPIGYFHKLPAAFRPAFGGIRRGDKNRTVMFQFSPDSLGNRSSELETPSLKPVNPYHFFVRVPSFSKGIQRNNCDDRSGNSTDADVGLDPAHFLHTHAPMRRGLSSR